MTDPLALVRDNIRSLRPYSSARDEFSGAGCVLLDANENPYNTGFNRYPDPKQLRLKKRIASLKNVSPKHIFLGNGSDEAIDLLIRAFCEPKIHQLVELSPTYGMYRVSADINEADVVSVPLDASFQPDVQGILNVSSSTTRILFLCSPNNPTGNSIEREKLRELVKCFPGIVIIDEAYIDFAQQRSVLNWINEFDNLVVLQTFSKAWGMAGLRLGMAFSSEPIQKILQKIKPPYNISSLTQQKVLEVLEDPDRKDMWVKKILDQREWLKAQLNVMSGVMRICSSDANFLLVQFDSDCEVYDQLKGNRIVVRDRSQALSSGTWMRITVGTELENQKLIENLKNIESK